ncbi:MAG TPA: F0F1 ATP synthase subunit B [Acetobacteraceae bacterium]|nr:F0F1 ATP synthase subunit B [Acetobacteraceae bacterium]
MNRFPPLARLLLGAALLAAPGPALAAETLPQMDFANPLTTIQILWMAVIMVVLYIILAGWALPRIGGVIESRSARIHADLEAARQARHEAERAVAELNLAIRNARESSQATIARSVEAAKAQAAAQAETLNRRLEAQLAEAEARIGAARTAAMSALNPVAEDLAATLMQRLTGAAPAPEVISRAIAAAKS